MVSFNNLLEVVQWAFQKTDHWTPKIQDGRDPLACKSLSRHIIGTKDHPISIKFGTQQQVWNSVTVTRPNVIFFKFKMSDSDDHH